MDEVIVRSADKDDAASIERIVARHNAIPDRLYTASLPLSKDSTVQDERQAVFVAIINSSVIGYLNLHWNMPTGTNRQEAEFEVVVDPGFRRFGAARELLNKAIKYLTEKTKVETVIAKIRHGNIGSERLCSKLGFTKVHQDNLGAYWEMKIGCRAWGRT
jgi:RimJ/RimL family protein N-acetyltransferase